jgi:xanthine dehydrogenase FAD-binding subunit
MSFKEVLVPKTVEELLPLINNETYRLAAGCTDIVPALKVQKLLRKPIISLNKMEEIKNIIEKDEAVFIGSNVSLSTIIENTIIKTNFPLLVSAVETIGSPQIRNRATLGGNLQNASPSGDSILALILLQASLELRSSRGERSILVEDFIKGVGRTDLEKDEFIEYIVIPKVQPGYKAYFEKVGLRSAMIIAVASMGILYKLENRVVSDIKVGFGAVAPKALRIKEVEEYLKGKELRKEVLERAGEIIGEKVSPIDDLRASAEYRRKVCKNLILRLFEL